MIERRTLLAAAGASILPAAAQPPQRLDWCDPARNRTIPVLIRRPAASGPAPLVLLSHGLGGSREGLAYLGQTLAQAGFIAVHLQHQGSDSAIWQGAADPRAAMMAAVWNVGAAVARLGDVTFALDHIGSGAAGLDVDPARIAIAGHSYGAWTVSHMLGERLPLGGFGLKLPEPRLRAGIALSPIPPLGVPPGSAYGGITAPILYVTGTQDHGMGVADWRERTAGFRNGAAPAVLAVLDGATHSSFAGEAELGGRWNDPTYQARTAQLARLFLDATLRDDPAAEAALVKGAGLARNDVVETKGFG